MEIDKITKKFKLCQEKLAPFGIELTEADLQILVRELSSKGESVTDELKNKC